MLNYMRSGWTKSVQFDYFSLFIKPGSRDKIFLNPGSYAGIRVRKRLEEKSKIDKPASFSDFVRYQLSLESL